MANPITVEVAQREWTKVAGSCTGGRVDLQQTGFAYYQTYRLAGNSPPENPVGSATPSEAVRMFQTGVQEEIDSSTAIDVYVFCFPLDGANMGRGKVRVSV
jgi:hypothetical protein